MSNTGLPPQRRVSADLYLSSAVSYFLLKSQSLSDTCPMFLLVDNSSGSSMDDGMNVDQYMAMVVQTAKRDNQVCAGRFASSNLGLANKAVL